MSTDELKPYVIVVEVGTKEECIVDQALQECNRNRPEPHPFLGTCNFFGDHNEYLSHAVKLTEAEYLILKLKLGGIAFVGKDHRERAHNI